MLRRGYLKVKQRWNQSFARRAMAVQSSPSCQHHFLLLWASKSAMLLLFSAWNLNI
jgi:hypothetical protein